MAAPLKPLRGLAAPEGFLRVVLGFERQLAKVLAVLLVVVIVAVSIQLVAWVASSLLNPGTDWFASQLVQMLDRLLMILIALEVLQNLTAYLRDQVVQIELVLVTGLTALARKVIVLPPGIDNDPAALVGLAAAVVALAGAYWLVRQAHDRPQGPRRGPTTRFRGLDRWPPPGAAGRE